jgi:hypothetical protein
MRTLCSHYERVKVRRTEKNLIGKLEILHLKNYLIYKNVSGISYEWGKNFEEHQTCSFLAAFSIVNWGIYLKFYE